MNQRSSLALSTPLIPLLALCLFLAAASCGDDPEEPPVEESQAFSQMMKNSPTYDEATIRGALPKRDFSSMSRGAYFNGLAAVLYGYPAVLMYAGLHSTAVDKTTTMGSLNELYHADRLTTPKDVTVPTPNNDTLYSVAWLDLNTEPLVLSVPKVDNRYYTIQLMDFYTSTFDYLGSNTTGSGAGTFIIAGPKWVGLPKGLKVMRSPTPFVWLLGRTLIDGPQELSTVTALIKQYKLQPLSTYRGTTAPTPVKVNYHKPAALDSTEKLDFFRTMGYGLELNPPLARDRWLTKLFHLIGFKADWAFDPSGLSERQKTGLRYAVTDGLALLMKLGDIPGKTVNGWSVTPKGVGTYGINYPLRAVVAYKGLGALPPEEASYTMANVDGTDKAMEGVNSYELGFAAGKLPPAKAFWSVTMYDFKTRLLVDNPINRYSLGDRTPGLVKGKDGSLTLQLQQTQPAAGKANWLPAPKGRFYLVLRLYNPTDAYLSGAYEVPGIKKVK